jgi:hypothetical protein
MSFDPRSRLTRRVPGASIEPAKVFRLNVDESREPRPDPIPARDQKELLNVRTRSPRRIAEAGPNAPQLIRLIRTPYAMDVTRGRRITLIEAAPAAQARQPFGTQTHAALEDWPSVGSPSPIQPRPRPFTVRPSADEPIPPAPEVRS